MHDISSNTGPDIEVVTPVIRRIISNMEKRLFYP